MSNSKIISILFLLLAFNARSQDVSDSTQNLSPKVSSVAFYVDYGKLFGQFLNSESKYEFGSQLEFKNRWVLIGEYGWATLNPDGAYQNTDYESKGNYFRVGLGYKIDMSPKNNIYLSFRYARSDFSDSGILNFTSASGIYNDISDTFDRDGLSAVWYEAALSSEARLWKSLYAGFHLRLRVMYEYDEQTPLDVYTIPGYGRTFDQSIPALNLYLKYALERF